MSAKVWPIDWYNCTDDDGKFLWRVARSIGPLYPDNNHWASDFIEGEESEILLAAAAPKLLKELEYWVEYANNATEIMSPSSLRAWIGSAQDTIREAKGE